MIYKTIKQPSGIMYFLARHFGRFIESESVSGYVWLGVLYVTSEGE